MRTTRIPDIVPRIRRARGFRLYDGAGRRYVDLYQAGGCALLGHRSPGTVRVAKDALSRGLHSPLPSVHEDRLKKLLRRLFPAYGGVELFSCLHRGLEAASAFLGRRVEEEDVPDPALAAAPISGEARAPSVAFWRPFLDGEEGEAPDVLFPILPSGGIPGFAVVCFRTREGESVPEGDSIPAYVLAAVLRAAADLKAVKRAENSVTRSVDGSSAWRRKGPYISAAFDARMYPEVFRVFLDAGFLLNPFHPGPSIVPGEISAGEEAGLCRLFSHAQKG